LLTARLAPSLSVYRPQHNIAVKAVQLGLRRGVTVTRDECQEMAEALVRRGVLVEAKLFSRDGRKPVYGLSLADEDITDGEDSPF